MTIEEALAIVEIALDYDHLNKVQDLVFRESWKGRSYIEIAKSSGYETDYIKDAGAKLWKLLSKAFGEKVKKDNLQSVLKRYLRRNQVNFHRTHVIGVNLGGASLSDSSLSGAKLTVTRLLGNLYHGDLCQADLDKARMPKTKTDSREENLSVAENYNEAVKSSSKDEIHCWNGLYFRSDAQVNIAEALERAGVLFFPNSKARLTTSEGSQNQESDFLICYQGKWGILEICHPDEVKNDDLDGIFREFGVNLIQHYDANQCREESDQVVRDFLELLIQADSI